MQETETRATAPPPLRGWRLAFSPLQDRQFRWLLSSNLGFFMALGSQGLVRAWLAFELTQSKLQLGLVMFAFAVPMTLVAPIGGALAERIDRRKLILGSQAIVIVTELVVVALILTDRLGFIHLLLATAVGGCAVPCMMPARTAIVADILGRERIAQAYNLNMVGMNMTRMVGPAMAGLLLGAVGVAATYFVGIGLYAIGLLCVLAVAPAPPPASAVRRSLFASIGEGFAFMGRDRLVAALVVFGLVPLFLTMPTQNLLVVFAEEVWEMGPSGFGVLSSVVGVGGFLGTVGVAAHSDPAHRLRMMIFCGIALGVCFAGFALSPDYLMGLVLLLFANAFASAYGAINNVSVQLVIPDEVRGRISGFLLMSFGLPMLGTLPLAAAAEAFGAPLAVAGASVLAVAATFTIYAASPSLRRLDDTIRERT